MNMVFTPKNDTKSVTEANKENVNLQNIHKKYEQALDKKTPEQAQKDYLEEKANNLADSVIEKSGQTTYDGVVEFLENTFKNDPKAFAEIDKAMQEVQKSMGGNAEKAAEKLNERIDHAAKQKNDGISR